MRDITLEDTFHQKFTTRAFATGIPTILSGTPVLSVYEDDNLTQITAGVSLGVDHDSVVGLNLITVIATAANGYESGKSYDVVITAGTVGGVSVVGEVVHSFTIDSLAKAVWDRVLTGATHNIVNSAARILRFLRSAGTYTDGLVWLDLTNGFTGTDDFENGTEVRPAKTLAEALTLLGSASMGLHGVHVAEATSIAFTTDRTGEEWTGVGWTLALGGRNINSSSIVEATISGVSTGIPKEVRNCFLKVCTWGGGDFIDCAFAGNQTLTGSLYHFFNTHHALDVVPVIDYGATIGATVVHMHHYHGSVQINNMGQVAGADVLHFSSPGGVLTLDATCVGGTANLSGTFKLINNSSGMTINLNGAVIQVLGVPVGTDLSDDVAEVKSETALIKAETDKITLADAGAGVSGSVIEEIENRATPAQVNAEVDNALNTAIPGSPTADSVNERVKTIDDKLPAGSISDFDEASNNVTLAAATHTGATIPTVISVTNLHGSAATSANQTTILNRIGDFAGSGLNTLKGFFQALFRKDAGVRGANLPSEINETENATSGAYDPTTDSQEALRDDLATQASLNTKIPTNLSFTGADVHVTLDGEKVTLAATTHTGAVIPTVSALTGHTPQSGDTFAQLPTNFSDLTISVTTGRVTAGTVSDKTGYQLSAAGLNDILRTALTEGYAPDGSAPTVEQFMFMIWSALSEFAISGTTISAKKLDGASVSMTFTLDSNTDPTSRTRAT